MSEEKFTKGQWEVDKTYSTWLSVSVGGVSLCEVDSDQFDFEISPTDEQQANADLIAAAPEMYRTLGSVVKKMRKLYPHKENDLKIAEIVDLLAKSRGEHETNT